MTTQDSITIQESVENRTKRVFPHGFPYGFPLKKFLSQSEKRKCANQKRKSVRGQKRGKCGSDPTLFGLQPPKNSWDRSRTFLKPLARATTANQTPCKAICKDERRENPTIFAGRIISASGLGCCKKEAFAEGDTTGNREESNNYTLHFFNG
jgi:hypothetical protein